MSTAARPTYYAAVGAKSFGGVRSRHYSGKDQIAHTQLKFRQVGQSTVEEMRERDLKSEIDLKETTHINEKNKSFALITNEEKKVDVPLLLKNKPEIVPESLQKYDDADVDDRSDDGFGSSSDESDDDDDEDDDEQELQAELERIREERAAAQAKKAHDEQEANERLNKESSMKGNPLMNNSDESAMIKRRWNDDVVFRNQTKDEPEHKKRFINDTIRSDFHRSFLKKFVQ